MARSNGRAAVVAALCALGYASWVQLQLAGFVNASGSASSQALRSRVSLAATSPAVEAAFKEFKLQQWAADKLVGEGSPLAAAAAGRAQAAEAAYNAAKAAADGMPAPASPVAAAAPVAAPVTTAVSDVELAEAKKRVELLTWAANKLAGEGSLQASTVRAKADQAVAAYEALKTAKEGGVAAAPAPVAAAPVAAGGASAEELAEAKKQMELLTWAAKTLVSKGSPQAGAIKAKADLAVATYEAMKQGGSAPAAGAVAAAPAPVAAAPAAAVSAADLAEAGKRADLLAWAANALASKGSSQAAAMQSRAQQAAAAYEALKQQEAVDR